MLRTLHMCSLCLLDGWSGMVPVEMEGVGFGLGNPEEHGKAPVETKGFFLCCFCGYIHNCSQGGMDPYLSNAGMIECVVNRGSVFPKVVVGSYRQLMINDTYSNQDRASTNNKLNQV